MNIVPTSKHSAVSEYLKKPDSLELAIFLGQYLLGRLMEDAHKSGSTDHIFSQAMKIKSKIAFAFK